MEKWRRTVGIWGGGERGRASSSAPGISKTVCAHPGVHKTPGYGQITFHYATHTAYKQILTYILAACTQNHLTKGVHARNTSGTNALELEACPTPAASPYLCPRPSRGRSCP